MNDILSNIHLPPYDPGFYPEVFALVAKQRKELQTKDGDNFKRICSEEYTELSKRLDQSQVQSSISVRNVLRTRRLANLLITDKGELNTAFLPRVIQYFTTCLYSLGPHRQHDAQRQEQILKILYELQNNKSLIRQLKQISKPIGHKFAEQMIRDTLQLPSNFLITDAHAKRAALSALFCYLRQSVGSCFATAPAIMIHKERPELFLKDIYELLGTGRLKRTFGGVEYTVPLSFSWGAGDLKKGFLMKRDLSPPTVEIWQSPGLINALKTVDILDPDLPSSKCRIQLRELLVPLLQSWEEPGPVCFVTTEVLLRRILLQHYQLTEQDVQDYENRPQGMIHSSLLMQMPKSAMGSGGKGATCSLFLQQLERAENAFKGLSENALLKSWEFSLASFCDIKTDFSRWNLYSSLGLGAEEPGGIGRCLYEIVQRKLNESNAKVAEYQAEYEQLYTQLKYMESRVKHAASEREVQWLKADYQSRLQEFHTFEEMRDKVHRRAKALAASFQILIDQYLALFPQYFQEVYDADMHDITGGQYDDSPAGFRLLYKHGRSNTSQWTKIHSPQDFIQALTSFFISTENEISANPSLSGLEQDLSEIVTNIVHHIKTQEFLETAFYRMATYHRVPAIKNPLEHLDKIDKKPWAYTSGGTMDTLLSCYYRREQKPTQATRWMENVPELFVFLLDSLKQIPYKQTEEFSKQTDKGMLMYSPTHAFLLKPGTAPFKNGWSNDAYTYVWMRDHWIQPMTSFVENLSLDEAMMETFILRLSEEIPPDYQHHFKQVFEHFPAPKMNTVSFRQHIEEKMSYDRGLNVRRQPLVSLEEIDSLLYQMLPMFHSHVLGEKIEKIFQELPNLSPKLKEGAFKLFEEYFSSAFTGRIISAKELQDICKALLCLVLQNTSASHDYHALIASAAQKLGFAMPKPIIFADTNWEKDFFGGTVNPGTGQFELWRFDYTGSLGTSMVNWTRWLDGSNKNNPWGVYTRPYEYSS